jgi:hypothetical protein
MKEIIESCFHSNLQIKEENIGDLTSIFLTKMGERGINLSIIFTYN